MGSMVSAVMADPVNKSIVKPYFVSWKCIDSPSKVQSTQAQKGELASVVIVYFIISRSFNLIKAIQKFASNLGLVVVTPFTNVRLLFGLAVVVKNPETTLFVMIV